MMRGDERSVCAFKQVFRYEVMEVENVLLYGAVLLAVLPLGCMAKHSGARATPHQSESDQPNI